MRHTRKIIEIDESKCTGCGQCVNACAEGALAIVDGKAKLVGEVYCDGLGACLGECPEGALKILERDAYEFSEKAVKERARRLGEADARPEPAPACGCPGARAMTLDRACAPNPGEAGGEIPSALGHWPVKLQLLSPQAPFLLGADLLLVADCAGIASPEAHRKLSAGKAVAIGCPKLDDLDAHIERLAEILAEARPKSLTVVHMEVPCCRGFVVAAERAIEKSGVRVPLRRMMIARGGAVLEEETLQGGDACG
jgi:Pyruvate/2-oxoacid:ferredoxin oxidoreductase delta subunit